MAEWLHFVESAIFTKQINDAGMDVLSTIQSDLLKNPTRGSIIAGTNGARKARVGDSESSSGKSGGYRYMYLYLERKCRIHLLFLFGKRDQANLSPQQKKVVASMISAIQKEAR